MNAGSETDAVSNLLKKLYKELPSDSVFWFLKCWLGSEDTLNDPHSCVISRGDAKGRMRRIDGGKGSDKVSFISFLNVNLYVNSVLVAKVFDFQPLSFESEPHSTSVCATR